MKNKTLIGLIMGAALIAAAGTLFYYSFFIVDAVATIQMDVTVGGHPGLNANSDAFHFGQVVAPGAGWRKVMITNAKPYPLYVMGTTSGEMERWMIIGPNRFTLQPGETETMAFRVEIPEGTPYGTYNSTAKIVFKRT